MSSQPALYRGQEAVVSAERVPLLCTDLGRLRCLVREALLAWHDLSAFSTFLLSLDGLSGSGKSTLKRVISDVVERIAGISLFPLCTDRFIRTPRDSSLRRTMTDSTERFWSLIFDRHAMVHGASQIVHADGRACSIPVHTLYSREDGSVGPGTIAVPAGRKVLLAEGIDATRIAQELSETTPCPQMRISVFAQPHIALERAAKRDAKEGRRTLCESRALRRREFQYLLPQIVEKNTQYVDVIYMEGG